MINTTMTDDERRFLDSCLKIYREDGGVATPSGKLITNLVDEYSALGTLSPKSIARHVAEFNENLEAPIQNARRIAGAYPDLFAGTMVRPAAYGR